MPNPVLEIQELSIQFQGRRGPVQAVQEVSLSLARGEILGIIGESGCGKSTLLSAVMGLLPRTGRVTGGWVLLEGRDLVRLPEREMRRLRGKDVAMIFQDPLTALNPFYPVGRQIEEAMAVHGLYPDRARRRKRVLELLAEVGIPDPDRRYRSYPHQFSGGMQQRVVIATALAGEPRVLLADEPTTALDVTVQAQILDLLQRVNRDHGTAIILVSHDLRLAAQFCHRIAVMYAGRVVEVGPALTVMENPRHPYTQGLLRSLPEMEGPRRPLEPIPGSPPNLVNPPSGCAFHPRCPLATDRCRAERPVLAAVEGAAAAAPGMAATETPAPGAGAAAGSGHQAACHLIGEREEVAVK